MPIKAFPAFMYQSVVDRDGELCCLIVQKPAALVLTTRGIPVIHLSMNEPYAVVSLLLIAGAAELHSRLMH